MKQERLDKTVFPVIPLRGLTVLPGEILHCDIGRRKSLSAMEQAITEDGYALFVAQKDPKAVEITAKDLNEFGTVCRIRQVFRIQGETVHLLVTGVTRAEILSFEEDQPHFVAKVFFPEEIYPDESTAEALRRRLTDGFRAHAAKKDRLTQEQQAAILEEKDFSRFTDSIAQHVAGKLEDKQRILEETDVEQRALDLLAMIENEMMIMEVDQEIAGKVRAAMEQNQKEFVLREQLKAVQKELGGGEEEQISEYQERAKNKVLPEEARKVLEKQIERYSQLPQGSHDAGLHRTDSGSSVGGTQRGQSGSQACQGDPGQRPLRNGKGQGQDCGSACSSAADCQSAGADFLPGWSSGSRKDFHSASNRGSDGKEICPDEPWRGP